MTKFIRIWLPDGTKLKVASDKYDLTDGILTVYAISTGKVGIVFPSGGWLRFETQDLNAVVE